MDVKWIKIVLASFLDSLQPGEDASLQMAHAILTERTAAVMLLWPIYDRLQQVGRLTQALPYLGMNRVPRNVNCLMWHWPRAGEWVLDDVLARAYRSEGAQRATPQRIRQAC